MKRFLIISLAVVLVVVMMAVPALAATSYEIAEDCNGPSLRVIPPVGYYVIRFLMQDGATDEMVDCYTDPFYWDVSSIDDDALVEVDAVLNYGSSEKFDVSVGLYGDCGCGGFYGVSVKNVSGESLPYSGLSWESYEPENAGDSAGSALPSTDSIFAVFAGVGTWLVAELGNVTSLFYHADTGLTLLGVLAVCGLGFAVVFLLISWIRNLLHFRS